VKKEFIYLQSVLLLAVTFNSHWVAAQTFSSLDDVAVFDSTGKKVGNAISVNNNEAVVAFDVGDFTSFGVPTSVEGGIFLLIFRGNRPLGFSSALIFESPACTGIPYVSGSGDRILPKAEIAPPGHTIYIAPLDEPIVSIRQACILRPDGTMTVIGNPRMSLAQQAYPLFDLDQSFTPNFTIKEVTSSSPGSCTFGQTGDACNVDADCCSNKCLGRLGSRTCKGK